MLLNIKRQGHLPVPVGPHQRAYSTHLSHIIHQTHEHDLVSTGSHTALLLTYCTITHVLFKKKEKKRIIITLERRRLSCEEVARLWNTWVSKNANLILWDKEKEKSPANLEMRGGGRLHLGHNTCKRWPFHVMAFDELRGKRFSPANEAACMLASDKAIVTVGG